MQYFLAILFFFFVHSSFATPLKNIVIFGDSLSDMGNLYEYMHHQLPQSPPYYTGRFSDGPVWVEYLMKNYFDKPEPHILNYAFGGAGILEDESDDDDGFFTLKREIDTYLMAHGDKADPNSMFVVWIGGNNYLGVPEEVDEATNVVMKGIEMGMERLIQAGAHHFLVMNLPDLDKTPLARELDAVSGLNQLSTQHNQKLQQLIQQEKQKHPALHFIHFDVNQYFKSVLEHPQDYGITNGTASCNDTYLQNSVKPTIFSRVASAKPQNKSTPPNCTDYFFFDLIHPTTHIHELAAQFLYELLTQEGVSFKA